MSTIRRMMCRENKWLDFYGQRSMHAKLKRVKFRVKIQRHACEYSCTRERRFRRRVIDLYRRRTSTLAADEHTRCVCVCTNIIYNIYKEITMKARVGYTRREVTCRRAWTTRRTGRRPTLQVYLMTTSSRYLYCCCWWCRFCCWFCALEKKTKNSLKRNYQNYERCVTVTTERCIIASRERWKNTAAVRLKR